MEKEIGINNKIRAESIILILANGSMKGPVPLWEALKIGEDEGLDVVEVAKKGDLGLPVCKLMDYGKKMYEQSKKKKSNKQTQRTKEIKYGLNIDLHDLGIRHQKVLKFLSKKYMVKYILELKGREKSMLEQAVESYNKHIDEFKEIATWKKPQISHGRRILISTTLVPL